jgi:hypothetical protein
VLPDMRQRARCASSRFATASRLNLRRGRAGLSSVVVWASEDEKQTRWLEETRPVSTPRSLRHRPPAEEFSAARDAAMRMHSEAAHHDVCWSCGQADGRHARSCERNV